ncbi:proline dehydrogenase family protein [Mucilaginibacter arboris]|uniref:Proline dehydrogenase n=1 Tax=Mucilaginibacter arboris TaxID=2682090 RepID=A0A7K1SSW4_9SPHI|nr:proline dehydrogenase family protein [Mucilaginibacter arboris]MVN20403.1 proline dehydrogenase [Mucilaginibacter arboris]
MEIREPNQITTKSTPLSFENTEIAFRHESNADLKRAYWLFKIINLNFLVKIGPPITNFAFKIGLPIKPIIKATVFNHFCGGETIAECGPTIRNLQTGKVGTILDYSVEGENEEAVFDETRDQIIATIKRAKGDTAIPLTVFKVTGVGSFEVLEQADAGIPFTSEEEIAWQKIFDRVDLICHTAFELGVPVMIDAEETWIQRTIDLLALNMMRQYNQKKVIVYNTYQLYRRDKLASLKEDHKAAVEEGFLLGAKLVRGAYMEKENKRAAEKGYPTLIQPDKKATDRDYDLAIRFCAEHLDQIAFVAGTHNEQSCKLLADLLNEQQIEHNHPHVYFSQLLGMSDNLSFNLANAGYNVAKYVPFGPVKAVLPYLFRRAQENTAIAGQTSRELGLISKEKNRRRI